jgi:DNA-binding transcriptional MerR regulator
MDQVTSFMEKELKSTKRNDDDKVLTKTMINNYAKNDLLPAPIKKKYSKEHLLLLTFIYYFKNIISMKDIETLLKPITESYFQSEGDINIARIYDEVCAFEKERTKLLQKDIELMFKNSMETFSDVDVENRDYLQFFSFICSLSLDVYVKQLLIEKLIDATSAPAEDTKNCEKDKEKKKKE